MKISLKNPKYLSISKKFSPKDWFFQTPQVRVPLQNILIFAHSESYITAGSYGTGILAGNTNQTHFRFWSGVCPSFLQTDMVSFSSHDRTELPPWPLSIFSSSTAIFSSASCFSCPSLSSLALAATSASMLFMLDLSAANSSFISPSTFPV